VFHVAVAPRLTPAMNARQPFSCLFLRPAIITTNDAGAVI
jgi:hypothetical protein